MNAEKILDGLDAQQREAAEALLGPVCILAGAGTGKTRALTHRIAYGVATGAFDPERMMALTFTTRAAGELRTRLRALGAGGVSARTFHAAALAQLNFFWPRVIGGQTPRILAAKGAAIAHAAESVRMKLDTAVLRDVAAEIEWRKVSQLTIEQYARAAASRSMPNDVSLETMVALHEGYERIKDERRQIDFEDVLLATAGMLDDEPWVAEQVRAQYRFFVVDEYQDVSPLQQSLLDLWLGPRRELCVVGDASQTIYSFTGATSDYLLGFGSRYPGARVVRLENNYRSERPVLELANRLMRGRAGALELTPALPSSSRAEVPAPVAYDTDVEEARAVAAAIAEEIAGGTRPEQIAVLYRVNAQGPHLQAAIAAAGVSVRELGGTKFFDLDVVKRAILELGSVAREQRATPEPPLFQSVSDVLRANGWSAEAPEAAGAVRERWEALNAIIELADQAPAGTSLAAFVAELRDRQAAQHEPTLSSVVLSTLHSAKGLEWDSVYLVGLSEGLVPVSHARGLAGIDEERRLLYVGITRARRRLSLSWSRAGLRGQRREPSRFLAELGTSTRDAGQRAPR